MFASSLVDQSEYLRRVCEEECVRMSGESECVRWKHIKKTRVLEGSPPVHNDCHKKLDFSNDVHHCAVKKHVLTRQSQSSQNTLKGRCTQNGDT